MPQVPILQLHSTMVHEIPRGKAVEGQSEPVLSHRPMALQLATDRFIREEMLQPSFAHGREIVSLRPLGSPIPQLARTVLNSPDDLPEASQEMARHLHKSQRAGSAGVFLCADARAGAKAYVVMMKAEHQQGMQLRQVADSSGEVRFEAKHLDELILGRRSQVFKVALIWEDGPDQLRGLMVDRQNGLGFADYFLDTFLGFELMHSAEKMTSEFVRGVQAQVSMLSQEKQVRYIGALATVLESPSAQIDPADFVHRFIDPEDRASITGGLPQRVQHTAFAKDTTLVRAVVGGLRLVTESGVVVQALPSAIEDGTVSVDENKVVINSPARDVALSRAPGR